MLATIPKSATRAKIARDPTRTGLLRPSNRRKISAVATAPASTRNGTKSPRYLGAMYPHNMSAAPALPEARSSKRVRATLPTDLGRKAVINPQILRRKSSGDEAGRLAVRYSLSKRTPFNAVGGLVGRVTHGNTR